MKAFQAAILILVGAVGARAGNARRLTVGRWRGGAEMEYVCDGDVCTLKPVASKGKKAKSGSKRLGKGELSEELVEAGQGPGWFQALRKWAGGAGGASVFLGCIDAVGRLFGLAPGPGRQTKKSAKGSKASFVSPKRPAVKEASAGATATPGEAKEAELKKQQPPSRAQRRADLKSRRGGGGRGGASRNSAALRIQRELREFQTNPPPGLAVSVREGNLNVWVVSLTGVEGTLFEGEKHKLRIEFSKEYPTKPPSVYFLKPTPRHPHVYTNGDICLDLLGRGWKPQITVRTLAISILSMLSSCKEKGIPPDNANQADNAPGKPQEGWLYHDDHC